MARPMYTCFTLLLIVSLALFFGLFFGLNYSEIKRHGWPLARCTVLSSVIATRYCCETSCATGSCRNAPGGSPQCGPLISSIDTGYSPSACASNSSSCPSQIGSVCDGGSYCCGQCCSTCTSCTSSCSGNPPSCSQSCSTYSCNCYCCSSSSHLYCTLMCPICYAVDLQLLYSSRDGELHNVSYVQDFSKNVNKADDFFNRHLTNSTSFCYYNPKNEAEVALNVSFTAWKWAITSIFGILPLFSILSLFAYFLLVLPCWHLVSAGYRDMSYQTKVKAWAMERLSMSPLKRPYETTLDGSVCDSVVLETPPPAYEKENGNLSR